MTPTELIEQALLKSAHHFESAAIKFPKCDRVLRRAMEKLGLWSDQTHEALCSSGYEDQIAGSCYDILRELVKRGLLQGKGNLDLPAGPRYTECQITPAGQLAIKELNDAGSEVS